MGSFANKNIKRLSKSSPTGHQAINSLISFLALNLRAEQTAVFGQLSSIKRTSKIIQVDILDDFPADVQIAPPGSQYL